MANVRISELPLTTSVPVAALLPLADDGVTKAATLANVLATTELAQRPLSTYTSASNDAALADSRRCIITARATPISLRIRLQSAIPWLSETLLGGINTGAGTLTITAEGVVALNGSVTVPQNGWWWAKRTAVDIWQVFTGGNGSASGTEFDNVDSGTTKTIALSSGEAQKLRLTGNCTLTITLDRVGWTQVRYYQDGTGGHTLAQPGTIEWVGGSPPVIAPTHDASTIVSYFYNGTTLYGSAGTGGGDLKSDGSVGLSADWAAGAHDITVTQDPGTGNALSRKSYVDAAIAAAVAGAGGGGGDGFSFTFSATTTDADPGAGTLRFNNATPASVTSIFVDLTDTGGSDITAWLDRLDDSIGSVKGYIRVGSKSSANKWHLFSLSSVTSATGYRKLVVTYVAGSGGLPNTTASDTFLSFESMGVIGTVPVTSGGTGLTALGGALKLLHVKSDGSVLEYAEPHITGDGFRFTYSATTTDADPGNGTLRLNNATIGSVTTLFVDLQEALGTDVTAWLDSLDDSGAAILGRVRLQSISDPTKWAIFNLTGWTTATGYRKLTVVYVAGPGGFTTAAADTLLLYDRGVGSGNFGAGAIQTTGSGSFGSTTTIFQADKIPSTSRSFVGLLIGSDASATELPASGGTAVILLGYSLDIPVVKPGGNAGFTVWTHDVYGINSYSQNGVEQTLATSGSGTTATRKLVRVDMQPIEQTLTATTQVSAIECDTTSINGQNFDNGVLSVSCTVVMYQQGGNNFSHTIRKEACFHKRSGTLSLRGSVGGTGVLGDSNPPSVATLDASGALIRMRIAPFDATSVVVFATMTVTAISP